MNDSLELLKPPGDPTFRRLTYPEANDALGIGDFEPIKYRGCIGQDTLQEINELLSANFYVASAPVSTGLDWADTYDSVSGGGRSTYDLADLNDHEDRTDEELVREQTTDQLFDAVAKLCEIATAAEAIEDKKSKTEGDLWTLQRINEFDWTMDRESTRLSDQTTEDWIRFLGDYLEQTDDLLKNNRTFERLERDREDLIAICDAPEFKEELGVQDLEGFKQAISSTPIEVVDPLLSAVQNRGLGSDPFGSFFPGRRVATVNPFSIDNYVKTSVSEEFSQHEIEKHFALQLTRTLVHELVHSCSNNNYALRSDAGESSEQQSVSARQVFSTFFNEAMTEKIAGIATSLICANRPASELPVSRLKRTSESNIRRLYDVERSVLTPPEAQIMNDLSFSAYMPYRIVLDTVFGKLDWSLSGISAKEAEHMAVRAFLEYSNGDKFDRTRDRKLFVSAVDTAAHRGFFVKIGKLVDTIGPDSVIDILEDPNLDLTSPDSMPNMASPAYIAKYWGIEQAAVRAKSRYRRLIESDMPPALTEPIEDSIIKYTFMLSEFYDLISATQGLAQVIKKLHGGRKRDFLGTVTAKSINGNTGGKLKLYEETPERMINPDNMEKALARSRQYNSWSRYSGVLSKLLASAQQTDKRNTPQQP